MAQVWTGKVIIPGTQPDTFLDVVKEAEEERAPFRASLATTYSTHTVTKHAGAVELFIHFLCAYTNMEQLEAGMRGMVNSPFRRW